ncbi:MAG TPA: hypothetical protein VH206_06385 [Xanthobacteraceae bacterium]|jgi:hypothetical protein|nr:hypothetical protein [Xanthobacteraceae bacterium]
MLRCCFKLSLLAFCLAQASIAYAQAEASFLAQLTEHLAEHVSLAVAERIVDHVLHGEDKSASLPAASDEALKQLAHSQVKACIERAKWLDDHNPQRPYYMRDKSTMNDPFYAHDVELYHNECDGVAHP